eukprot:scaffold104290_cov46-Phaeocystis_antarctica.AAC.1
MADVRAVAAHFVCPLENNTPNTVKQILVVLGCSLRAAEAMPYTSRHTKSPRLGLSSSHVVADLQLSKQGSQAPVGKRRPTATEQPEWTAVAAPTPPPPPSPPLPPRLAQQSPPELSRLAAARRWTPELPSPAPPPPPPPRSDDGLLSSSPNDRSLTTPSMGPHDPGDRAHNEQQRAEDRAVAKLQAVARGRSTRRVYIIGATTRRRRVMPVGEAEKLYSFPAAHAAVAKAAAVAAKAETAATPTQAEVEAEMAATLTLAE